MPNEPRPLNEPPEGYTAPCIVELPLDEIHIDATYTTTFNPNVLRSMCDHLRPELLGILLVNRRTDGSYWVIDGATRVLVLRQMEIGSVSVELHEGMSWEDERAVYELRRTTFEKHPMDLYKAQLVASGLSIP